MCNTEAKVHLKGTKCKHEGKRVNGGLGFDTDTYVYTATDGSA